MIASIRHSLSLPRDAQATLPRQGGSPAVEIRRHFNEYLSTLGLNSILYSPIYNE